MIHSIAAHGLFAAKKLVDLNVGGKWECAPSYQVSNPIIDIRHHWRIFFPFLPPAILDETFILQFSMATFSA